MVIMSTLASAKRNGTRTSNTNKKTQSAHSADWVNLPDIETNNMPAFDKNMNGYGSQPVVENSQRPSRYSKDEEAMQLELKDGTLYRGVSFGASKSIAGELVFQTGMVGYPESITDPSYRGQILVVTFPLVGNYGVPSRQTMDAILGDLPAHFEASQIHVSGLVVASYCGEDYSHFLATSSLGTWLKEQGVPAMHGVDTRALTKRIREEGSMLGKLRLQHKLRSNVSVNGNADYDHREREDTFENIDWYDPNKENLVADGKDILHADAAFGKALMNSCQSLSENLACTHQNRNLPSCILLVGLSESFASM